MIPDLLDEFLNPSQADIPPFFEPGWNVWIWLALWALLILSALAFSGALAWWAMSESLYDTSAIVAQIFTVIAAIGGVVGLFMIPFKMFRHTESWGSFWGVLIGIMGVALAVYGFCRWLNSASGASSVLSLAALILLPALGVIAAVVEAFTKIAGQIPTSVAGLMGVAFLALIGVGVWMFVNGRSRSY